MSHDKWCITASFALRELLELLPCLGVIQLCEGVHRSGDGNVAVSLQSILDVELLLLVKARKLFLANLRHLIFFDNGVPHLNGRHVVDATINGRRAASLLVQCSIFFSTFLFTITLASIDAISRTRGVKLGVLRRNPGSRRNQL